MHPDGGKPPCQPLERVQALVLEEHLMGGWGAGEDGQWQELMVHGGGGGGDGERQVIMVRGGDGGGDGEWHVVMMRGGGGGGQQLVVMLGSGPLSRPPLLTLHPPFPPPSRPPPLPRLDSHLTW